MQTLIIINLLIASFSNFPPQNENCSTDALIIGKDLTKCGGCWGWQVQIGDKVYLTDEITQLGLKKDDKWTSEHPIPVKINFGILEDRWGNRIVIHCLEKVISPN